MESIVDPSLDASDLYQDEGWVEITPADAIKRIEGFMTIDTVAFEMEYSSDQTPIGNIVTHTWFTLDQAGEQRAVLLALREPKRLDVRWFIHADLIEDTDRL